MDLMKANKGQTEPHDSLFKWGALNWEIEFNTPKARRLPQYTVMPLAF
jgi:hypothetical protein